MASNYLGNIFTAIILISFGAIAGYLLVHPQSLPSENLKLVYLPNNSNNKDINDISISNKVNKIIFNIIDTNPCNIKSISLDIPALSDNSTKFLIEQPLESGIEIDHQPINRTDSLNWSSNKADKPKKDTSLNQNILSFSVRPVDQKSDTVNIGTRYMASMGTDSFNHYYGDTKNRLIGEFSILGSYLSIIACVSLILLGFCSLYLIVHME